MEESATEQFDTRLLVPETSRFLGKYKKDSVQTQEHSYSTKR